MKELFKEDCVREIVASQDVNSHVTIADGGLSALYSVGVVTGDESKSSVDGTWGVAVSTGDASSSEVLAGASVAVSTGYKGAAVAEGHGIRSVAVSMAKYSKSNTRQEYGVAVSVGDRSTSNSEGLRGTSVATGYRSISSSYGKKSVSVGNAYGNAVVAMAAESIAVAWGPNSKAKGVVGSYLVLSEWEYTGNWYDREYESAVVFVDKWKLVDKRFVLVDGKHIKADTWYQLISGEVREVVD